eukprot:CAMPEP_0184394984 /NCGR_PEP_ID=MMETSP0007-20130409/42111_1 /TAXON_ID=97485 /ORGANISM="Prymnesium parvum, Strain Texoma1" /LENGTH=247 /DNA_ID=CAMNT_0026746873 /DNA_START=96 /DNA_END=836 /DNA_ORIENTATION=-
MATSDLEVTRSQEFGGWHMLGDAARQQSRRARERRVGVRVRRKAGNENARRCLRKNYHFSALNCTAGPDYTYTSTKDRLGRGSRARGLADQYDVSARLGAPSCPVTSPAEGCCVGGAVLGRLLRPGRSGTQHRSGGLMLLLQLCSLRRAQVRGEDRVDHLDPLASAGGEDLCDRAMPALRGQLVGEEAVRVAPVRRVRVHADAFLHRTRRRAARGGDVERQVALRVLLPRQLGPAGEQPQLLRLGRR